MSCSRALWWDADGSVREKCGLPIGHGLSCRANADQERPAPDFIHEPPHYKSTNAIRIDLDAKSYLSVPVGKLEARHVIEAFGLGWHAGNAVKYLLRAGRKGALLDDLRKAENMIGILIAFLGGAK